MVYFSRSEGGEYTLSRLAHDLRVDIHDYTHGNDTWDECPQMNWSWKQLYRHIKIHGGCRQAKLALLDAAKYWRSFPFVRAEKPPQMPGVYCVSFGVAPHAVKIGRSENIAARIASFGELAPGGVILRAILSFNPKDEKKFHKRFAAHRLNGEWFDAAILLEI